MKWQPIEYRHNEAGTIIFPSGAPFDGEPVLIKAAGGVVEARWWDGEWSESTPNGPAEFDGFMWVCYDDAFQLELDEPTHWAAFEPPVAS